VRFLLYKGKTDPAMPPFFVDNVLVKEKTDDGGSDDGNTDVRVTAISISPETFDLETGSTQQLVADITPANATNLSKAWSSSDESVATVSQDGLVTAIAEGAADITVNSVDGGFEAVSKVNVIAAVVSVTGINISADNIGIKVGETTQLTAEVLPVDASNKSVVWSSSDESIATVATDGTVTAVSKGIATITVVSKDGNFSKTCEVTVDESATVVENLIVNGDFETGEQTPWTGYKSGAVGAGTTAAYEGDYCGRIERNDGSLIQVISVEAGKTYQISFQSKWIESATNTFSLKIKDQGGDKSVLHSYEIPKGTDWQESNTEFVCPAGTTSIKFLLYKGQVSPVLPAFFVDNVVVKEKK